MYLRGRGMRNANCAGVGCPERSGCTRFEERQVDRWVEDGGGVKHPKSEWGSFDVERERFGNCAVRTSE